MILGLDISTSKIGVCILKNSGELAFLEGLELSKEKNVIKKSELFKSFIEDISTKFDIKKVLIEENLQAFRPGLSSAKTIVTLARFNGICTYISSIVFDTEPDFVNVNNARKRVGLKIERKSTKNTKEQVLDFVKLKEPKFSWPTKILKGGPNRGNEVLQEKCYDMADAYIIASSFFA